MDGWMDGWMDGCDQLSCVSIVPNHQHVFYHQTLRKLHPEVVSDFFAAQVRMTLSMLTL